MTIKDRVKHHNFKATVTKRSDGKWEIKPDPPHQYVTLALMLHNEGYQVTTNVITQTIIAEEKKQSSKN